MTLRNKDLVSISDLTKKEIESILSWTDKLKKSKKEYLKDKSIAMIFGQPSTRTRLSFEVAMTQLGGHAIYFSPRDSQISRGESLKDTAKVLSRYVDGVAIRVVDHEAVIEIAKSGSIPVINALTSLEHPCQALADMYTIKQKKKKLKGLKLAFMGDPTNVCNSLVLCSQRLGINMSIGCPKGFYPDLEIMKQSHVDVMHNAEQAVKNADIVYTDTWSSMGQKHTHAAMLKKKGLFKPFQVNSSLLEHAKKNAIVMHCLMAHRGEEITSKVMDGPQSVVFDQAENRLHVQKAILYLLIK